jgi:hypothetical protein
MRARLLFPVALALAACAGEDLGPESEDIEAPDDEGKADAATELSVRAGGTTLTVARALVWRDNNWVLRGKTSRNLEDVRGFVFDDIYGQPEQKSPRVYEMSWGVGEARTLVDGVNLFTTLSFVHSASRPDSLTARAVVRPRLGATSGSSTLALTAELTPVVEAGHTVYRIKGRSTKAIASLRTTMGEIRATDGKHFEVDLDFDQLMTIASPGGEIAVTATFASGSSTIRAPLGLSVKKLGLTTGDVYELYPVPECTPARESCLRALPDGALGTASCGEAIEVRVCQGTVGTVIDQAAIAAAQTAVEPALTALATDGVGLVGAERAPALAATTREVIAGRLAHESGAWLPSATARATVLNRATGVPIDDAYAFPLSFVDGFEPVPGDVAVTRQIAADAILGYVKAQDYASSALGRSYLELTKVFRAQHVASLKAFREEAEVVTFPNMPGTEFYVGAWIGLHTEVTVDRTTGEPTNVLVEID